MCPPQITEEKPVLKKYPYFEWTFEQRLEEIYYDTKNLNGFVPSCRVCCLRAVSCCVFLPDAIILYYFFSKKLSFFQRMMCLEMNIWIRVCWNWFILGARKCSLLRGGDVQLASAASKAGCAGKRESVGKVPRERADSQLPSSNFCERSTPLVAHRSDFTLGT